MHWLQTLQTNRVIMSWMMIVLQTKAAWPYGHVIDGVEIGSLGWRHSFTGATVRRFLRTTDRCSTDVATL